MKTHGFLSVITDNMRYDVGSEGYMDILPESVETVMELPDHLAIGLRSGQTVLAKYITRAEFHKLMEGAFGGTPLHSYRLPEAAVIERRDAAKQKAEAARAEREANRAPLALDVDSFLGNPGFAGAQVDIQAENSQRLADEAAEVRSRIEASISKPKPKK